VDKIGALTWMNLIYRRLVGDTRDCHCLMHMYRFAACGATEGRVDAVLDIFRPLREPRRATDYVAAPACLRARPQEETMATILLIDDDLQMRRTLARMLRRKHDLIEAADGSEGIRLFTRHHPDIVITDIIMPNKEGIETIMELRRLSPTVKILAISGGGSMFKTDFLSMAEELGADATLQKPIELVDLLATVDQLLPPGAP
jgi:two-component system, chemotaxis family, chemotaxis protein CheY